MTRQPERELKVRELVPADPGHPCLALAGQPVNDHRQIGLLADGRHLIQVGPGVAEDVREAL